jgi:hypothetical protein
MSRGLGEFQREILDTIKEIILIEDDQQSEYDRYGSYRLCREWDECQGYHVRFPRWVCDTRKLLKMLARKHDEFYFHHFLGKEYVTPDFSTGFSRAIRGLLGRKLIYTSSFIPIEASRETGGRVVNCADGVFFSFGGNGNRVQNRFVTTWENKWL